MTEPTQINPSPKAVPWTPEMMNSQPAPAIQPPYQQPHQMLVQPQPSPMTQAQAPIPNYAMPSRQISQSYAHPPQLQSAQPMPVSHQPAQIAAEPVPQMNRPQLAQTHPAQPHPTQPNHGQPHFSQINQQQAVMHVQQSTPPPLTQHIGAPAYPTETLSDDSVQSKSLFAKLLKRSPKPEETQMEASALVTSSESLFNKNFVLGALTGLVIGAFVLPMALDMIGGDASAQAQAGPTSGFDSTPPITEGETFLDSAIAADAP